MYTPTVGLARPARVGSYHIYVGSAAAVYGVWVVVVVVVGDTYLAKDAARDSEG